MQALTNQRVHLKIVEFLLIQKLPEVTEVVLTGDLYIFGFLHSAIFLDAQLRKKSFIYLFYSRICVQGNPLANYFP